MDQNELYNLLIRYIDGEANAEEALVMEELLRTDAYWKNEFDILNSLNEQIPASFDYSVDAKTDKNWEALRSQLEIPDEGKTIKLWPAILKYAAAASIIIMAGWFLYKPSTNEFSSFDAGKTYKTGAKEVNTFKLEDGTQITLNENSSLTLDKEFNGEMRLIELKGEAYFEVAKNAEKPFIAKTKNTYTKVLGTSFEIEANGGNEVSVILFEGKVQFTSGKEKAILTPGQKLNCSVKNNTIEKHAVKDLVKDAWIAGLSFKDAKLIDIAKKLERTYKISLSIPAGRTNEQYTASFEGLDLSASLRLLEELTDSKITKKDSVYILNP